jgi:hypothetical protein
VLSVFWQNTNMIHDEFWQFWRLEMFVSILCFMVKGCTLCTLWSVTLNKITSIAAQVEAMGCGAAHLPLCIVPLKNCRAGRDDGCGPALADRCHDEGDGLVCRGERVRIGACGTRARARHGSNRR